VQIDVSGSISKAELDHYAGHLQRIVEDCSPDRVHVLYVDTSVRKHIVFERGEPVELAFYSGAAPTCRKVSSTWRKKASGPRCSSA